MLYASNVWHMLIVPMPFAIFFNTLINLRKDKVNAFIQKFRNSLIVTVTVSSKIKIITVFSSYLQTTISENLVRLVEHIDF